MYVYELYKALSETADEPSDVNSQGRDHVLNWLALRPTLSLPPLAVRPPYTLSGPAGACPPPAPPSRAWEESPESARIQARPSPWWWQAACGWAAYRRAVAGAVRGRESEGDEDGDEEREGDGQVGKLGEREDAHHKAQLDERVGSDLAEADAGAGVARPAHLLLL
eukprot:scaffold6866_cov118-Isochrysis_galbana.AAC.14